MKFDHECIEDAAALAYEARAAFNRVSGIHPQGAPWDDLSLENKEAIRREVSAIIAVPNKERESPANVIFRAVVRAALRI